MTVMMKDEIEALLDGTTPGPWQAAGEPWNRIVWSSAENRVCFMAHSNGLDDDRDIATSNLIAAAPDLARTALDALAQLADAQAAQALRADHASRELEWATIRDELVAERDALAAKLAAAEARVGALTEAGQRLLTAARELRDYASYAEIVGGVSVNRPHIREWCDAVADAINSLPEDENYERSFAALTTPAEETKG